MLFFFFFFCHHDCLVRELSAYTFSRQGKAKYNFFKPLCCIVCDVHMCFTEHSSWYLDLNYKSVKI